MIWYGVDGTARRKNMKSKALQWLAMILILEIGILHYLTAQLDYLKINYLGYLDMLLVLGALIAIFGIYYRQVWGYIIGSFVALFSISAFVWSSTLGLPGLAIEPWIYPYGLVESAAGGLFLVITLAQALRRFASGEAGSRTPVWFRILVPALALLIVISVSYSTYQWDRFARAFGYHQHVGSLASVCRTPITTFAELEQKYGMKVSQVTISMLDSVVDVRLLIVDPDKAQRLLQDQGALLVDQEVLVLAPHQHTHWKLKKNLPHIMFFSTQNNTIHSGSEVSLVFGRVRVEPVIVK
jgi:hypothetical protein